MVKSYKSLDQLLCINDCSRVSNCKLITFNTNDNTCKYYNKNLIDQTTLIDNPLRDKLIYRKQIRPTEGLINYWSFNGHVNDTIGEAHLYDGVNASLT
jgi:hypothetical protein